MRIEDRIPWRKRSRNNGLEMRDRLLMDIWGLGLCRAICCDD